MVMIQQLVALLAADKWLIGDPDIDMAKGKYELPRSFKELRDNRKRWQ